MNDLNAKIADYQKTDQIIEQISNYNQQLKKHYNFHDSKTRYKKRILNYFSKSTFASGLAYSIFRKDQENFQKFSANKYKLLGCYYQILKNYGVLAKFVKSILIRSGHEQIQYRNIEETSFEDTFDDVTRFQVSEETKERMTNFRRRYFEDEFIFL